ncbi:hypothetical protein [Cellulosilyticum sp. I15G10I2]|uniref:hypothetical protein n=1 Tax=Cellulosilyticum sp. I15G10I2 TaxID=1892843 RepID=UPI00085C197F|nr:hypothetical protein [Cellulosilyticum sp. I15G10I2]
MKRSKLLVGVLVASMALLGTGYAYWTDILTVKTTVSTGELNVVYETDDNGDSTHTVAQGELKQVAGKNEKSKEINLHGNSKNFSQTVQGGSNISWYYYANKYFKEEKLPVSADGWSKLTKGQYGNNKPKEDGWYTTSQYVYQILEKGEPGGEEVVVGEGKDGYIKHLSANLTNNNKGIVITAENFYPGSFASVTFSAVNTGTIPAVIDYIELDKDNTALTDLAGILKVDIVGIVQNKDNTSVELEATTTMDKVASTLDTLYKEVRLEEGKKLTTTMTITFPGLAASKDEFEKVTGETFTLNINWKQHNALSTERTVE